MKLIGRAKEQQKLREALTQDASQLVAVYGIRRVGKTYLIENTLSKEVVFDITGISGADIRTKLSNFKAQLKNVHSNILTDQLTVDVLLEKDRVG